MRCCVSFWIGENVVELLLRHVAGAQQEVAEPVVEPARRRLGGDDLSPRETRS